LSKTKRSDGSALAKYRAYFDRRSSQRRLPTLGVPGAPDRLRHTGKAHRWCCQARQSVGRRA